MDNTDKCRKLAGAIASNFKDGIWLDHHVKAYIDTCFPDISIHDLVKRLCKKPDFDDAPIMELIFFPDETLQIRLEPLLQRYVFYPADENEVVGLLLGMDIQTKLRKIGNSAFISMSIPASALTPFVRRLNISRQIPKQLILKINGVAPTAVATLLMVKLRNARFDFSPPTITFLECFFKGIDTITDVFNECVGIVIGILEEQKNEASPYILLRKRKEVFIRAKESAVQFMRQLQRNNMETLMQWGIRPPEIGIEEAEKKVLLLDRIMEATKTGGDLL